MDKAVENRCQAVMNAAEAAVKEIRTEMDIRLKRLDKKLKSMPLKDFHEQYGGNLSAVIADDISNRMQAQLNSGVMTPGTHVGFFKHTSATRTLALHLFKPPSPYTNVHYINSCVRAYTWYVDVRGPCSTYGPTNEGETQGGEEQVGWTAIRFPVLSHLTRSRTDLLLFLHTHLTFVIIQHPGPSSYDRSTSGRGVGL